MPKRGVDWAKKLEGQTITCAGCGEVAPKTGSVQRLCRSCAKTAARRRGIRWARNNPLTAEQKASRSKRSETRRARLVESAVVRHRGRGISWMAGASAIDAQLWWTARTSIPFDKHLSKNAMWSNVGRGSHHGQHYVRAGHRAARELIAWEVKRITHGREIFEGPLWIDILVQKPNHRFDAVNFLDGICDGVKLAVGIDDNWFAIRRLDWEIVKTTPRIYIGVGQAIDRHHRCCSYCGELKPLTAEHFNRKASAPHGLDRVCKPCSRLEDADKRKRRRVAKELSP